MDVRSFWPPPNFRTSQNPEKNRVQHLPPLNSELETLSFFGVASLGLSYFYGFLHIGKFGDGKKDPTPCILWKSGSQDITVSIIRKTLRNHLQRLVSLFIDVKKITGCLRHIAAEQLRRHCHCPHQVVGLQPLDTIQHPWRSIRRSTRPCRPGCSILGRS
jgi:hypothetical protein